MRVKTHTAASFLLQSSKGSNHSVGRFFWLAAERGTPGRLAFSDVGWFASAAGEKPAAKRHKRRKEGKNSAEQAAHAVALAHRAEQRREGEANGPRGQRPPGASRTGPSWTEFVRPAHQAVGAFAGADMINRAEPRACGHSREPIPPDSEPEAERNAGSASNAAGDGGGRARSDKAGFQPYWGKPAVGNDKRGWRKRGQDLMAICHDARKGRNTGSHWSKPVAPPLHSTGWKP